MSINASVDLNSVLNKIQNSTYGIEFICVISTIIVVVACIYFLAKSGVVSGVRDYSDHRRKKRNEIIAEHQKLLKDKILKDYSSDLEYHIKVSKLENYLNVKNKDLDLLTYILSCRDRVRAVRLYKIGKKHLEKEKGSCTYKLKEKFTSKRLKVNAYIGTILYIGINLVGSAPYIYLTYLKFTYKEQASAISNSTDVTFILFFILVFIFSIYVLWEFLRPEAAKNFLEMDKIGTDQTNKDALDAAA
ncbi:MAG: hypothetical protein ACK410_01275 [Acinetobacter sp.]